MPSLLNADEKEESLATKLKQSLEKKPAGSEDFPEKPEVKQPEKKEPAKEPVKEPEAKVEKSAPANEEEVLFGEPKKPAKVEAAQPLEEDSKGMTEKARERFAAMRHENSELKKDREAKDLALKNAEEKIRQLEQGQPSAEDTRKELEELREQIKAYEDELTLSRFESTKTFKEQVKQPKTQLENEAKKIATKYEASEKDLLRILNDGDTASLKEFAADFDEADKDDLYELRRSFSRLAQKEEELRSKAKERGSRILEDEQKHEDTLKGERLKLLQSSAQKQWEKARQECAYLAPNENAPEWTAALKRAEQESLSQVEDTGKLGEMQARAAQLPFVLKALQAREKTLKILTEERDGLLDRIAEYERIEPGTGGRKGEEQQEEEVDEKLTVGQAIKQQVRSR